MGQARDINIKTLLREECGLREQQASQMTGRFAIPDFDKDSDEIVASQSGWGARQRLCPPPLPLPPVLTGHVSSLLPY